ncbi:hypothetical protein AB9F43_20895 [Rhizobium leguminosarum]|uniref:hypothetical protein n=1 Tax=Rhizobium leguminosarum TaxID=384 RepID=UPI003F98A9F3
MKPNAPLADRMLSQHARDFVCLLDVDPDVPSCACVGVELTGKTYLTDFVVSGSP